MQSVNRRIFLTTAGASLAAATTVRGVSAARKPLQHAVLGVGNQGRHHALVFDKHPHCRVVALCDVDPERLTRVRGELANPETVRTEMDYRRVLDDPSIDSVSIATPDHWHTKLALHALEAGKHVYIEKPCSLTIEEARILRQAASTSDRFVQHGTHSRGSKGIREGIQYLQEGHLGTVRVGKAINQQLRKPIGRAKEEAPPEGVDYDMWLGPAPVKPFTANRWHYNWHWFWDYGCGDIGNDGIHQLDQVLWGMGLGLPNAISGAGGQLFYQDDHETPDTQTIIYEYDNCHVLYEMRLWCDYPLEGHDNGVIFYCDNGTLEIGRKGCIATHMGKPPEKVGGSASFEENAINFIDAILADSPDMLLSPIDEGAISTALCHMGNIVTLTGRRLQFNKDTWRFDDDAANALLGRTYREGYELPTIG